MPKSNARRKRTPAPTSITIAPRLIDGIRVRLHNRLPEPVKEGLRDIARSEAKSMSWVVEEVIIRYFKLDKPQYRKRK